MKTKSIILVGMSNVGKSYWREKLSALGFEPFWCDDKIEAKLGPFLKKNGYRGIEDVARWMGQPYESKSKKNCALYLAEEVTVMEEAIRALKISNKPLVIDTTGSVIYIDEKILRELKRLGTIVMLDAPESLQKDLYQKYLTNPKPVIWGGNVFKPIAKENPKETLARCYPILLKNRNEKYRKLAHVVLDYKELHLPDFTANKFLKKIADRDFL